MPDPNPLDNKDNTFVDDFGIVRPIGDIVVYTRRTRGIVRWLFASITLDLVLSLGLGFVAVQANTAAETAGSAAHTAYVNCEAANDAKKVDFDRWTYIISLGEGAPRTPAQEKDRNDFIDYIEETSKPTVCVVA